MKIESHNGKNYKVTPHGTHYSSETPDEVIEILERAIKERIRLKFYYGDRETGRDYLEESDTVGKIGRSTGEIKIPLLLAKYDSIGGPALFDSGIVKIVTSPRRELLWQHKNYHQKEISLININDDPNYTHALIVDGDIFSRHSSQRSALRLQTKLL
jgi:hypothetical protein